MKGSLELTPKKKALNSDTNNTHIIQTVNINIKAPVTVLFGFIMSSYSFGNKSKFLRRFISINLKDFIF